MVNRDVWVDKGCPVNRGASRVADASESLAGRSLYLLLKVLEMFQRKNARDHRCVFM